MIARCLLTGLGSVSKQFASRPVYDLQASDLWLDPKGPATRNDIVDDARADAIFATLKTIVNDIVTCGRAFRLRANQQ